MRFLRLFGLSAAIVVGLSGCPSRDQPARQTGGAGTVQAAFPPDAEVEVVLGNHDTLGAARQGLEAALKLAVDLPLPFPRVERHGDHYRVVAARGRYGALQELVQRLARDPAQVKAAQQVQVMAAADTGGGDVIRLGIVCTTGETVPLFESAQRSGAPSIESAQRSGAPSIGAAAGGGQQREKARLGHGQVVVLGEEGGAGGEAGDGDEAERGLLRVLAPQAGLMRDQDVLLPADCTPRDEDNDDGNGRLLAGGRLCLTTRTSGHDGEVVRATLVAVAPSYRRCVRFPDAGTFDGFDHNQAGTQFAVETAGEQGRPALEIYDVGEAGQLTRRLRLPGLLRPAYLQDHLVAAVDEPAGQGLVVIDLKDLQGPAGAAGTVAQRRILTLPGPRFVPAVPVYRPAAPTMREGRVVASFHLPCNKAEEQRVRRAAHGDFEQCLLEIEVEVGLDGKDPKRRCQINNAPSALEEPISVPCR